MGRVGKNAQKTAHRSTAVRLLFLFFCIFAVGLIVFGAVEYGFSLLRPSISVTASASHAPVLRSAQEDNALLNINTASAQALSSLPGIGPAYARAIIDYREKIGGFHFPEELMDVPGIGQKRLDAIRDLITCGD